MEGYTRKTSNHYGYQYQNSHTYSNGIASIYGCKTNSITRQLPHLHEDYRPIYFYVAQPYTIPYTFAKRPKQSSLQKSGKQRSNYRVKFSKKLSNAEFSQKVKQGEFSKSLNQVQFVDDTIPGNFLNFISYLIQLNKKLFKTNNSTVVGNFVGVERILQTSCLYVGVQSTQIIF